MYYRLYALLLCGLVWAGCQDTAPQPAANPSSDPTVSSESSVAEPVAVAEDAAPPQMEIPTISLGGDSSSTTKTTETQSTKQSAAQKRRDLLAAMKPLQVMLGQWRGTTQKPVGDFKGLTEPEWVWDFQTNRDEPSMVMTSKDSPYFREVRLTYLSGDGEYQVTMTDPEDKVRTFRGKFEEQVEEFQGDDQKMHVKYKLGLEQVDAESARDTWKLAFNQVDNHRYLVELSKKRGSNFIRFDTVANQRQGTSFGKSDSGYGERECIISGGLGTMQVSYQGKSYWVCCTGCKAAFEEDPESWIAEYKAKKGGEES